MRPQNQKPDFFSSPGKVQNFLVRVGCCGLLLAQYQLVAGLIGIPATANAFFVVLLADLLLIFALRHLIAANIARDLLDLTLFSFFYCLAMFVTNSMQLVIYNRFLAHANDAAQFYFIVFMLRFFWPFKLPNSDTYYAWPIIGPFSWLGMRKSREPVVRVLWHSALVYLTLVVALTYSFFGPAIEHEEHVKQAIYGGLTFILFFLFFRPFMESSIAMADENIQYRNNEERLTALIASVQKQAQGQLSPELVEVMCMFSEMNDEAQKVMAGTIRDLHKKIMADKVPLPPDDHTENE